MSDIARTIFSGEPLPVPPQVGDPEIDAYNRKIIDYLRRLAAKIDRFIQGPGQGILLTFSGYFTGAQTLGVTYAPVNWTTELRKDIAVYEHDNATNSSRIKVKLPGFYVVMVDLEGSDQFEAKVEVRYGSETGYVIFSHTYISVSANISASIPLSLIADVFIVVHARGSGEIRKEGSRITIIRIAVDAEGWGAGTEAPWIENTTAGTTEAPFLPSTLVTSGSLDAISLSLANLQETIEVTTNTEGLLELIAWAMRRIHFLESVLKIDYKSQDQRIPEEVEFIKDRMSWT